MNTHKTLVDFTLKGTTRVPKNSKLALDGALTVSATNAITAFATGGQTSARALTAGVNRITVCATAGDSVKLPAAIPGLEIAVTNAGATAADVFPALGEFINGQAVNVAYRLQTNVMAWFVCAVAGTWNLQVPLAPAKFVSNTTVGATTAAAGDMTGAAYVQVTYTAVGAANLATRTAAQIIADGFLQVGDSYVLEVTNSSGGTTTITAGAGVTLTGTMTLATNSTRRFNVKVTAAGAVTIQNTGVGTFS